MPCGSLRLARRRGEKRTQQGDSCHPLSISARRKRNGRKPKQPTSTEVIANMPRRDNAGPDKGGLATHSGS